MWKGTVIKESLNDARVLWETQEIKVSLSRENNWHAHTILCEKETISKIARELKPGHFAHFCKNETSILALPNECLEFETNNQQKKQEIMQRLKQYEIPQYQLEKILRIIQEA